MSDFITFSPKLYNDTPPTVLTVNKADVVKIEAYHDGSAYLQIRGENGDRYLHPDDVERLRSELTGLPPQDPESILRRAEEIGLSYAILTQKAKPTTPDQTKP